MSTNDSQSRQLNSIEVADLFKTNPSALEAARKAGQLRDVMAGREPGSCPACHRPFGTDNA